LVLFQFVRFKQPFGVNFKDKGKIHLTIPGFDIPSDIGAPAHTSDLQWHVIASSYNIAENSPYGSVGGYAQTPFVRGTVAPQNVTLDFGIPKGTLTVPVVALRYVAFRKRKTAVVDEPACCRRRLLNAVIMDRCIRSEAGLKTYKVK
jgi:hypothetical protein